MDIEKNLPGIQKNVSLRNHTTFRIGGPAKWFFTAKNKKSLVKAVMTAKKFKLPFFILGGGSNVLINDKGFSGVVVKNEARSFKIKKEKVISESGTILSELVAVSVKAGLSGLAEGVGIPGTLGGAVYNNAGWPKGAWAIGDIVEKADLLMPDGKIKKVGRKWFSFKYRESKLKKMASKKPIILEVVLKLKRDKKSNLKKKEKEILKTRREKIPVGFSAGSVFKNPIRESAGFLIEKCGLKGKKIGNVKISEKHANFIINSGNGKAKDVEKLINLIKKKVKNKFKINLEEEIRFL